MDKFEEYIAYVGKIKEVSKERIREDFERWLESPAFYNQGFFCVRWVEDENYYNELSFDDFSKSITRRL